jgi:hypothetical protein
MDRNILRVWKAEIQNFITQTGRNCKSFYIIASVTDQNEPNQIAQTFFNNDISNLVYVTIRCRCTINNVLGTQSIILKPYLRSHPTFHITQRPSEANGRSDIHKIPSLLRNPELCYCVIPILKPPHKLQFSFPFSNPLTCFDPDMQLHWRCQTRNLFGGFSRSLSHCRKWLL